MKIIHFPQFSAPYKGSFINSLEALENYSSELEFVYCFPQKCEEQEWMKNFRQQHKVYFTRDDVQNSLEEIIRIIEIEKPDILHSHFDGYDIPLAKAKRHFYKQQNRQIKVIWHLRNMLSYMPDWKRKTYQYFMFQLHYGYWSKNVNMIGVSKEVLQFVDQFAKFDKNKIHYANIQNGIPYQHLKNSLEFPLKQNKKFTFGAFGSRNSQKRIDILLKASDLLVSKGIEIRIFITKGVDTLDIIEKYFNNNIPHWLVLIEQFQDVNEFFGDCDCFVSTSVHETFSNAIAEASIYGLPVIQSNIEGTMWNSTNPSTFVFKSLDAEDLANKMMEVIQEPKHELREKCKQTRELNIMNYGINNWCERIIDFYKNSN